MTYNPVLRTLTPSCLLCGLLYREERSTPRPADRYSSSITPLDELYESGIQDAVGLGRVVVGSTDNTAGW